MEFQHLPAPNIVALWKLEDVNDSSGNSRTLTNINSVVFGSGRLGNCAQFGSANTNKYLIYSSDLGVDLSITDATVSFWVMIQTAPGTNVRYTLVMWNATAGTNRFFRVAYKDVSGTKKLTIDLNTSTYCEYAVTLSLNVWYKVDVVWASTTKIYLNGVFVASGTKPTTSTTPNNFCIGADDDPSEYVKGNIDSVVVFNYERSANQIKFRYAFENGLIM